MLCFVFCVGNVKQAVKQEGRAHDEWDRRLMMSVCTIPDRLLVLLVLFTVDDLYPTFPGPWTPWETADKSQGCQVEAYSMCVCVRERGAEKQKYSRVREKIEKGSCFSGCTFCVRRSCQWYVPNRRTLVSGTWGRKHKKGSGPTAAAQVLMLQTACIPFYCLSTALTGE